MKNRFKWTELALCKGAPNEIFFPTSMSPNRYEEAKEICGQCEVRKECLDIVIGLEDLEDRWGVFGGLTPAERSDLRWKRLKNI